MRPIQDDPRKVRGNGMMAEMVQYSTTLLLCGVETHEAASPSSQLPMVATAMERNTGFVFLS